MIVWRVASSKGEAFYADDNGRRLHVARLTSAPIASYRYRARIDGIRIGEFATLNQAQADANFISVAPNDAGTVT